MANPFAQELALRGPEPAPSMPDATPQAAAPVKPSNPFAAELNKRNVLDSIDFSRHPEAVRADVGKLAPEHREDALNRWADHFVAKENAQGGIAHGIDSTVRTLARGTFAGPWLDEATAASQKALQVVTGGAAGSDYDEALAYQRAKDRALDKEHPALSIAGKIAGGVAGGVGAIATQGPGVALNVARVAAGGPLATLTPAASMGGRVAQSAGVGGVYGANAGAGDAEGGFTNRAEGAVKGAAVGAAVGTALAPVAAGVNAVRTALARQGQNGAAVQMAEKLPGTVDDFANQVAVGGTRNDQAVSRRTLDILGEEMERAGGDRAQAVPAALARIQQEAGISAQAARANLRTLTGVHENSPLMMGEYPSVSASDVVGRNRQPGNVDLDALGRVQDSRTQGLVDYLANSGNSSSSVQVRNAINQRHEQLGPGMAERFQAAGPQIPTGPRTSRPATIQDTEALSDAARTAGSLAYRMAHQNPLRTTPAQSDGLMNQFLTHWTSRAQQRAGVEGDVLRNALNEFHVRDPQTGALTPISSNMPNYLQLLQDARSSIGKTIRKAVRDGDDNIVNALQPLYHDTRPNVLTGQRQPNITDIMGIMSPEWQVANRTWADMNFQEIAQTLGDAFSKKAGPQFREQLTQFQQMAPEAQNIVRTHWVQQQLDKLENNPDTHAVSKMLNSDHGRNVVRALLGDDAAVSLARSARDARVAEASKAGLANSRTHIRGQVQREMDADTGILASAENASAQGIKSWLMERLTQLLTEQRNRPLADIVTTPMNDTAAVAQRITQMRNAQRRVQQISQPNMATPIASGTLSGMAGDFVAPKRGGMALTHPTLR